MKLEDFIELTLKEVISGVTAAQADVAETEARINPPYVRARGAHASGFYESRENRPASFLEFDISVTTVEGEKGKVGAGVFVGPLALGAQGESETSSSSVGRIKFSLPILFPMQVVSSD